MLDISLSGYIFTWLWLVKMLMKYFAIIILFHPDSSKAR